MRTQHTTHTTTAPSHATQATILKTSKTTQSSTPLRRPLPLQKNHPTPSDALRHPNRTKQSPQTSSDVQKNAPKASRHPLMFKKTAIIPSDVLRKPKEDGIVPTDVVIELRGMFFERPRSSETLLGKLLHVRGRRGHQPNSRCISGLIRNGTGLVETTTFSYPKELFWLFRGLAWQLQCTKPSLAHRFAQLPAPSRTSSLD